MSEVVDAGGAVVDGGGCDGGDDDTETAEKGNPRLLNRGDVDATGIKEPPGVKGAAAVSDARGDVHVVSPGLLTRGAQLETAGRTEESGAGRTSDFGSSPGGDVGNRHGTDAGAPMASWYGACSNEGVVPSCGASRRCLVILGRTAPGRGADTARRDTQEEAWRLAGGSPPVMVVSATALALEDVGERGCPGIM